MQFKNFVRRFFFVSAILGVIACGVLYFIAPPLVESLVIQRVRQMPGLEDFDFELRHIGLNALEAGKLTTGSTLFVHEICLGYSLSTLLRGRLKGVEVSGLDARGRVSSRGVVFTDFSRLSTAGSASNSPGEASLERLIDEKLKAFIPMLPEAVQVKNSAVTLVMDKGSVRIPLELMIGRKENANLVLQSRIFPLGETVEATVEVGAETGIETVEIISKGFALARFQDVLDLVAPGNASDISLKGNSSFFLYRQGRGDWKVNLSSLWIKSPVDIRIKDLNLTIASIYPLSFSGAFIMDHTSVKDSGVKIVDDIGVDFEGGFDPDQNWRFRASLGSNNPEFISCSFNGQNLEIKKTGAAVTLRGRGGNGSVNVAGKIDNIGVKNNRISDSIKDSNGDPALGNVSGITLDGRGNFNLQGEQDILEMEFTMASGPLSLETRDLFVRAPAVTIPGRLIVDRNFAPRITMTPDLKDAEAGFPAHKVQARGISFNLPLLLPLEYPWKKNSMGGRFALDALIHDGQKIGNVKGIMDQIDGGFEAKATMDVKALVSEVDISFSANALATLVFEENKMGCSFDMALNQGRVAGKDNNFEVKGIVAGFGSNDLFSMQSRPGQPVKIESIRVNDILLTDASINYTVESMDSLLVEKIGFTWCDGRVTTESMRIEPEKNEYKLILFCDRLKLSEILRQVGSFEAKGDGTLNGRIPITFSNGEFSFDRGFLFSTPGRGGKISVGGTKTLLAGIPEGTAEYTQIDLASEALKDYQYKWARLLFNTIGETLVVNMSFDGEPENLLPFVYKKEIGAFARVTASSPGSKFQGIMIDVNLELPFNRVMKFGSRLNKMLQ